MRLADNPRSLRLAMSRDAPRHHGRVLWSRLGSRCAARYTRLAPSFVPSLDTLGEGTPCPTMNLSVRDAASLLKVSEKTIYRWIQQQVVPAYRVQEQYRFNRAELLEWATSRRLNVSSEIFLEPEAEGLPIPSLVAALEAGGVHYRVSGSDKAGALREVVQLLRLPDEVDREFLLRVLLRGRPLRPLLSVMGSPFRTCGTRSCCTLAARQSHFAFSIRPSTTAPWTVNQCIRCSRS